ncbi:MAG: hypothetical protein RL173_1027 [Fibrobacterota bacterium]|jgi:hypothetical protein
MNSNNLSPDLGELLGSHLCKAVTFKDDVVKEIEDLLGESPLHLAECEIQVMEASVADSPYFASIVATWGTNEVMIIGYNAHNRSIDVIFAALTPTNLEIIEEHLEVPRSNLHELLKKYSKKDIRPPTKEHAAA